ncbi:two-component regulator propeller domain-containing protein [Chitinophaga sp.]|uniref:two-component regulator propeller domain-containing protein n=1 Tax=Chitinophaga sp. TaxID=1869181 RepID=UPI00262A337F|nr:two-component regulator propeller domain-containing protein [uncultured Chitinophaga sp.]
MVLLFHCLPLAAQISQDTSSYLLQHYDNSSGLPQNSVNAIGSDPEGYIWLATEGGLVRYDGLHFRLRNAENPALRNNRFYYIYHDLDGRFSAMNYDNEVVRIEKGEVRRDTAVRLATMDYVKWKMPNSEKDSGNTYHIRVTNRPQSWGAQLTGLRWYLPDNRTIVYESGVLTASRNQVPEFSHAFQNKGSWHFFLLGDMLFFLGEDGRTVRFGPRLHTAPLEGDIRQNPAFRRNPAKVKLFWNRLSPKHLILYIGKTFYLASRSGDNITTRKLFAGFDMDAASICSGYYDTTTGRLFLGSSTLGLYVLSPKNFASRHSPQGYNSHYSLMPIGNDQVMANGHILSYPRKQAAIQQYDNMADSYSLAPDGNGGFWSKGHSMLYHARLSPYQPLERYDLPEKITMLYTDTRNQLWIGMHKAGIWTTDSQHPADPKPLLPIREDATCFAEDGNTMYIGTDGAFFLCDMITRRIDTVQGLNGKYIRSARVVQPREVWITTYDHGFFLYKNGRLTAFPYDNDRYIVNAHCMYYDRNGYFWIPTNKGLFQVQRTDLLAYAGDSSVVPYYHYYDRRDGFATNEFNGGCQPCAAELGNGYVALPSLNGLVFFHPDSVRPVLPALPISLDRVWLDKKSLAPADLADLPEAFNSLQLEFSTPHMGNRKNLQLNFALIRANDADTIWNPLPDDGRVMFSTLPPGDYSLLVRKLDGFGFGNYSDKIVELHVKKPWYESRVFYGVLLLLGIGITLLVTRLRTMYVNRKNEMLEKLVASKTRELQVKSALQDKIIQSVSHNILTPLKYQQLLSRKIFESKGNDAASFTEMARIMNDHTHYLYHMVANLLKYLKSQIGDREVSETVFAPVETADAVMQIFADIAREKGTALVNNIPGMSCWYR